MNNMLQINAETLQKTENIIRSNIQTMESFFNIAKSFSIKTNSFIEQFYGLIISLIEDDLQDMELPKYNSTSWSYIEKNKKQLQNFQIDFNPQSLVQSENIPTKHDSNTHLLKYLQVFKDQNQEIMQLVMKESANSSNNLEYVEKMFANAREGNISHDFEVKIEKQRQKIKNLKSQNKDLTSQLFEMTTKSKISETQIKVLNEELHVNSVRLVADHESHNSVDSEKKFRHEENIDILKQKIHELSTENNSLRFELESSLINVKHLEKSLHLLKEDISNLFVSLLELKMTNSTQPIFKNMIIETSSYDDLISKNTKSLKNHGQNLNQYPVHVKSQDFPKSAFANMQTLFHFQDNLVDKSIIKNEHFVKSEAIGHNQQFSADKMNVVGGSSIDSSQKNKNLNSIDVPIKNALFSDEIGNNEWRNSFHPNQDIEINEKKQLNEQTTTKIMELKKEMKILTMKKNDSSTKKIENLFAGSEREMKQDIFHNNLGGTLGKNQIKKTEKFDSFKKL